MEAEAIYVHEDVGFRCIELYCEFELVCFCYDAVCPAGRIVPRAQQRFRTMCQVTKTCTNNKLEHRGTTHVQRLCHCLFEQKHNVR